MTAKQLPPAELLNKLFRYDPNTGHLYRKIRQSNNGRPLELPTGTRDAYGYLRVGIKGYPGTFLAHRIIWTMVNGSLSEEFVVDHINHIEDDNRIANLRVVTHRQNMRNSRRSIANKTGTTGIHQTPSKTWVARIDLPNVRLNLGSFDTREEAIAARRAAELVAGFHINHGK